MSASAKSLSRSQDASAILAEIVEEVTNKFHAGVAVDVEVYVRTHPELAEQLRQLLPALHVLADLGHSAASGDAVAVVPAEVRAAELGELGDFRIVREIGRGGMGVVYEAVQISLGRRVALKMLPFAAAVDSKQLQRFKNEAQAAAHLQHTNIVPVYYVGCERGVHFYAMQYIEGQTLAAVIRELRQLAGLEALSEAPLAEAASALAGELASGRWAPIKPPGREEVGSCGREEATGPYRPGTPHYPTISSPQHRTASPPADTTPPVAVLSTERSTKSPGFFRTVAYLGVQAAEALEHAHQTGVIHRDIKPANLMVDAGGRLWVTDFGLAKLGSEAGLTLSGDLVGTLRYMSPEQALAKRVAVDARTDIYSLGVTLYELLTLELAYNGRNREEVLRQIAFEEPRLPRRLNKAVPAELETIVLKAMAKNPEERYATAQEVADDLRRFLDDKPIKAKRPTLRQRAAKWSRRHQGVVATAIVGLILAVGILAVSTLMISSAYRTAVTNLYHSYVGQAQALRQARGAGYRDRAWALLKKALQLDTPEKNLLELRQEAVGCMGDFVGQQPTIWEDFPAKISVVALHPQEDQVAIGFYDGTVLLRDMSTGEIKARLPAHRSRVHALAFGPGGKRFVSAESDGTIKVWEPDAFGFWRYARSMSMAPPEHVFRPLLRQIWLAITPDGKYLAACSEGTKNISLWSLADGAPAPSLTGGELQLRCMVLSADARLLAAGYDSKDTHDVQVDGVLVWDVATRQIKQRLLPGLGNVFAVDFSSDGRFLACSCLSGVAIYETAGDTAGFQQRLFKGGDLLTTVAISPQRHFVATTSFRLDNVRVWDPLANQEIAVLAHPGTPHSVAFSRSGSVLITADEASIRIWQLPSTEERLVLPGHAGGVAGLAFSPDGGLLASASFDRRLIIWNPVTGEEIKQFADFRGPVHSVAFSPDGRLLAAADWGGAIRRWEVHSWEELPPLEHRLGREISAVTFSPNGKYFAASGRGGLSIWSLKDGGAGARFKLQAIPGPPTDSNIAISSLSFNPDSNLLAWVRRGEEARGGHTVHLWDLQKCQARPVRTSPLAHYYSAIAFYPDGERLMFINDREEAEVWDVAKDQKADSFGRGEIGQGSGEVALRSDGAWLAVGGSRAVTVWDTQAKKLLLALPKEYSYSSYMAWSRSRELLAVGSIDGGIAIWNIPQIRARLAELGLDW